MTEPQPRKYWQRGRSWLCPECGKRIAREKTQPGSVRGLFRMHLNAKHPDKPTLRPVLEAQL